MTLPAPIMPAAIISAPVDCDVHPTVPSLSALFPYLDEMWREQAIRRGFDEMGTIAYPAGSPLSVRSDWRDAQGKAATNGSLTRRALMDSDNQRNENVR